MIHIRDVDFLAMTLIDQMSNECIETKPENIVFHR